MKIFRNIILAFCLVLALVPVHTLAMASAGNCSESNNWCGKGNPHPQPPPPPVDSGSTKPDGSWDLLLAYYELILSL